VIFQPEMDSNAKLSGTAIVKDSEWTQQTMLEKIAIRTRGEGRQVHRQMKEPAANALVDKPDTISMPMAIRLVTDGQIGSLKRD
jgi:hypothetical protein